MNSAAAAATACVHSNLLPVHHPLCWLCYRPIYGAGGQHQHHILYCVQCSKKTGHNAALCFLQCNTPSVLHCCQSHLRPFSCTVTCTNRSGPAAAMLPPAQLLRCCCCCCCRGSYCMLHVNVLDPSSMWWCSSRGLLPLRAGNTPSRGTRVAGWGASKQTTQMTACSLHCTCA